MSDADTDSGPDTGSDRYAAGADMGWRLSTAVVLFHEALGQRLGLRAIDHRALGLIGREGPLTAGALAELTGLTPGAVTGLVERLSRRGYVQRTPDPADRRRVLIAVNAKAGPDFADAFAGLSQAMADLMAKYDDKESAAITDYITNSIAILHTETQRLSAPDDGGDDGDGARRAATGE